MPGYNFQTYIDEFNRYLRWGSKATLPFNQTQTDLVALFTEAFRQIQKKKGIAKLDTTINLVASTYAHALPSTVMGWQIDSVLLENESDTEKTELTHKSIDFFRSMYDLDDASDTGTPSYWTVSDSAQRSILIAPPADYSKTGGIHITATIQVVPLWRIYKSSVDSYTATVSNGGTSVTISNSAPVTAAKIAASDEFGVIRTTDIDGSAQTNISPRKWYRISAASGTTLTLTDTFDEESASSLNFITAQVHPIEIAQPGVLGFLPVKLALAEWLSHTSPDIAFAKRAEAFQELMETVAERRGIDVPTQKIAKHVAWIGE